MKKFVIAAMIAACIALCTAVWLHGNAVGETPVPATKTAVSAKKATAVETETEENSASLAETETRFLSKKYPKRNVLNQRQSLWKYPQIPSSRLPQSRHPLRIPHQSQLRPNLLKNCSPVTKSI